MRILVTRPEPDASGEAERLAAHGHEAVLAPLLTIETLRDVVLDLDGVQALIVTSRNALRALTSRDDLERALKLPLFAVGGATARSARELGFEEVRQGPGTGPSLARLVAEELRPEKGALVHLAGETLAFDLTSTLEGEGFRVRKIVLYRTVPAHELSADALGRLKAGTLDGVILMSPRTAKTFAELLHRHGAVTQAKRLVCYCLSEAVAEAVASLGLRVRVASHPREEDVLALMKAEAASS